MGDKSKSMDFGPHADTTCGNKQQYINSYFYRRNARIDPAAQFNQTDRNWRARFQAAQSLSENDGKLDLYRNEDYSTLDGMLITEDPVFTQVPMNGPELNHMRKQKNGS